MSKQNHVYVLITLYKDIPTSISTKSLSTVSEKTKDVQRNAINIIYDVYIFIDTDVDFDRLKKSKIYMVIISYINIHIRRKVKNIYDNTYIRRKVKNIYDNYVSKLFCLNVEVH